VWSQQLRPAGAFYMRRTVISSSGFDVPVTGIPAESGIRALRVERGRGGKEGPGGRDRKTNRPPEHPDKTERKVAAGAANRCRQQLPSRWGPRPGLPPHSV
jgi:hypothetical protein